VDKVKKQVE